MGLLSKGASVDISRLKPVGEIAMRLIEVIDIRGAALRVGQGSRRKRENLSGGV